MSDVEIWNLRLIGGPADGERVVVEAGPWKEVQINCGDASCRCQGTHTYKLFYFGGDEPDDLMDIFGVYEKTPPPDGAKDFLDLLTEIGYGDE